MQRCCAFFRGRKYETNKYFDGKKGERQREKSGELMSWNVWKSGKMGVSKIYTNIYRKVPIIKHTCNRANSTSSQIMMCQYLSWHSPTSNGTQLIYSLFMKNLFKKNRTKCSRALSLSHTHKTTKKIKLCNDTNFKTYKQNHKWHDNDLMKCY